MAEPNLHKLCILILFPMQDFNGLLVCYSWGLPATYPAEKHSVAICLRSSHNLTGLYSPNSTTNELTPTFHSFPSTPQKINQTPPCKIVKSHLHIPTTTKSKEQPQTPLPTFISYITKYINTFTKFSYLLWIRPDGVVAKSSANGLVGTGFTSRSWLQPKACF